VGDVNTMAQYAISILKEESVLQRFRANALAQAKRFDLQSILPQYEAYYEHILETAVYTHG
ncbi:MAG: N-acetyl-alpha-D-glucosaminyl L-malate synthase BshA, partial [Bacteroidota bacterium]